MTKLLLYSSSPSSVTILGNLLNFGQLLNWLRFCHLGHNVLNKAVFLPKLPHHTAANLQITALCLCVFALLHCDDSKLAKLLQSSIKDTVTFE